MTTKDPAEPPPQPDFSENIFISGEPNSKDATVLKGLGWGFGGALLTLLGPCVAIGISILTSDYP